MSVRREGKSGVSRTVVWMVHTNFKEKDGSPWKIPVYADLK